MVLGLLREVALVEAGYKADLNGLTDRQLQHRVIAVAAYAEEKARRIEEAKRR